MPRETRQSFSRRGILLSALGAMALMLPAPGALADPDAAISGEGSGRPAGRTDIRAQPSLGQPSKCTRAGRHVAMLRDPDRREKVSRAARVRAQNLASKICDPNDDRRPFEGTTVRPVFDS